MADKIIVEEDAGHRTAIVFGKLIVGLVKFMALIFLIVFPILGLMFKSSSFFVWGIFLSLATLLFARILKKTIFPSLVRIFFYVAYGDSNVIIVKKK